jgi:hypothetical protein
MSPTKTFAIAAIAAVALLAIGLASPKWLCF